MTSTALPGPLGTRSQAVNGSSISGFSSADDGARSNADLYTADDFLPLSQANCAVIGRLRADEDSPNADLYRRVAASGNAPSPYFYSHSTSMDVNSTVSHSHSIPLSPFLARELASTKLSSLMGLLPEANLAWMSVDEKLYLWNYGNTDSRDGTCRLANGSTVEDFVSFAVPYGQCIVSIGLVKPKKGVFKEVVEWCLVVTTPEEAILCALARESTTTNDISSRYNSSLRLIPTRYVIPTDSVPILSVCGTNDGRIFLGGYDGNLYEMSYEGFFQNNNDSSSGYWYDKDGKGQNGNSSDIWTNLAAGSKRAMSTIIFGSNGESDRPRKCRKVNHTAAAPSLVSALLPGFVLHAVSTVFGSTGAAGSVAGPIVNLVMDHERNAIYALTSKGFIHAFDLSDNRSAGGSSSGLYGNVAAPPHLTCSIDVSKSARRYLDTVIRGRAISSSSSCVASISFTGGTSGAQNGVGGTDGAREILKMADAELDKNKFNNARSRSTAITSDSFAGSSGKKETETGGILSPVSIHVIPPSESKSLTLLAITGGGLRYYMSALLSPPSNGKYGNHRNYRPSNRFHLCHIRALPPFKTSPEGDLAIDYNHMMTSNVSSEVNNITHPEGINPRTQFRDGNGNGHCNVKKSFYKHGFTVMAIDSASTGSKTSPTGNAIIAVTPDYYENSNMQITKYNQQQQNANVGGVSETLSLPMAQNAYQSGDKGPTLLPGGTVWDMARVLSGPAQKYNSILNLKIHSSTPTDAELDMGFVTAYFPPSRIRQRTVNRTSEKRQLADSSLSVASHSAPQIGDGTIVNSNAGGVFTFTMNLLSNFLFKMPLSNRSFYSQYSSVSESGLGKPPSYKISERYGCGQLGFSPGAGGITGHMGKISIARSRQSPNSSKFSGRNSRGSVSSRSSRLSPWLLSPSAVPLSESVLKPLTTSATTEGILALNSGGFHLFNVSSTLDKVSMILSKSNTNNISGDQMVKSIFTKYGFDEGCAMCLSLAISGENEIIRRKAVQAALTFAHRPVLVHAYGMTDASGSAISSTDIQGDKQTVCTIPIPIGYTFQSSFLYDGLVALLSRLLRPIWCKPAVVVESRSVRSRKYSKFPVVLPASVELLLDDDTLEEIRRPLSALQNLLRDIFAPAVSTVPGIQSGDVTLDGNQMDVDELGTNGRNSGQDLITRALQYQSRTAHQNNVGLQDPKEKDLNQIARLTEDRNIHSVYRLVSRTVQLLTLISHLRRAHSIPELPEVEWGLLHGLTYCQLVTTRHGQDRIETILTNLVSSNESNVSVAEFAVGGVSSSSVEADNLSTLFASQCYHYFSAGSRLTHLGFRTANCALSHPPSSHQRKVLSDKAASYFRTAARNWMNPSLITGRLLSMENVEKRNSTNNSLAKNPDSWYIEAAMRAFDYGSPLARASSILMELGDVGAIVDICLICAGNFGGLNVSDFDSLENNLVEENVNSKMSWEKDLYHRPAMGKSKSEEKTLLPNYPNQLGISLSKKSSSSDRVVSGIEVTGEDAKRTCYAVLLYRLFSLLDSAFETADHRDAAERMVAVAASSQDINFLNMFFKNILESGYVDTLLRIDSPDLESWLCDVERDPMLLWRHYIIHGLDWRAGEVMWQRSRSPATEKISLNERMQCLTRAVNSYTAALEKDSGLKNLIGKPGISVSTAMFQMNAMPQKPQCPSSDELNRIIAQISEEIDVATIQHRILSIIESSRSTTPIDMEKLEKISNSLLNVTDLYNDYAAPLALYDVCLFILNTCRHNEASTITTLWKSIICEEILPCKTHNSQVKDFLQDLKRGSLLEEENIILVGEETSDNSNVYDSLMLFEDGQWISRLKNRVLSLGKELYGKGADFTFPLDFIIDTLDGLHRTHLMSSGDIGTKKDCLQISWPLRILMDAGVPFPMLLEAYQTLFEIQQKESAGAGSPATYVYYVSNICCVLVQWVTSVRSDRKKGENGTSSSSVVQLERTSSRILLQIDTYKSSLESLVGVMNDENVSNIYSTFSELEDSIKRLS